MLTIGIIGFGRIGRLHAHTVHTHRLMHLVAIADPYAKSESLDTFPGVQLYSDAQQMLDDADIDAVIICSPSTSHAPLCRYALQRHKHVFCEKPLALTAAEIEAIGDLAEQKNRCVQVGFNRRFDPNFQSCQHAIENGEIGQPYLLKITSYDPAPPALDYVKQSGGLLQDMAIHDFDMARFLVGDEVDQVFCNAAALHDTGIADAGDVDTVITSLRFKSGMLGVICNSRHCVFGYDQRIEVLGSLGQISVDNIAEHAVVSRNAQGWHGANLHDFFMTRYQQAYQNELDAFCHAITTNKPVLVGVNDALQALRLALAANASLQSCQPMPLMQEDYNEQTL